MVLIRQSECYLFCGQNDISLPRVGWPDSGFVLDCMAFEAAILNRAAAQARLLLILTYCNRTLICHYDNKLVPSTQGVHMK